MAYRDALRSRVLAGHGPTLAPAPGQSISNLSRTPKTRSYVASGSRLASSGVAKQTSGRESDRRSKVAVPEYEEVERGKVSLVPALEQTSTIQASASRNSVTGQAGGRGRDKESNVGVPKCEEAERGEASLVSPLEQTLTIRASASRDSVMGQTGGRWSNRDSNIGVAESGEAVRGSVLQGFEEPWYLGEGRGRGGGEERGEGEEGDEGEEGEEEDEGAE